MSYVIAVVGAGGKSTLIENLADRYASEGRKVCITTTTHIYKNHDRENIFYRGKDEGEKFSYSGNEEFSRLCDFYDVVLVEADGSKHFPIKIPNDYEPVIPDNTNEIIVVMGLNALNRPIGEVCHRFFSADKSKLIEKFPEINENFLVNSQVIDFIANAYYIEPLRKKFPDIPIKFFKNNFLEDLKFKFEGKKIALILLASGSSRRFLNGNKLLHVFNGKELFRYGLDALIKAKKILSENKIESEIFMTGGNISQYKDIKIIENPDRFEGISGSIRHGTETAIKNQCSAVLFLVGDQPNFSAEDIAGLVIEFICSGKKCGCAFSEHPSNPGIFDASMYGELLKLSGDTGAMKIIKNNPQKTHYYPVSAKKLLDIDTLNDAADF